jgi:5-methyltetrahydropteroyltriglutamate--homocysteine methyltransferase
MQRSSDRILTTHVGSLPRSQDVLNMLLARDQGELSDDAGFDETMRNAVADVVAKQVDLAIDIPSDGEMSKISYGTYIRHRLTGFEEGPSTPRGTPRDLAAFPEFKERLAESPALPKYQRPICRGPIAVKDEKSLRQDISHFTSALQGRVGEAFMNAASPGVIAIFQPNEYYSSRTDYLHALAEAMRFEYETINQAGLLLQVDCPDLAMERHITFANDTDASFLRHIEEQIQALNYALENVPADAVRMHVCWGNYEGPHTFDVPLEKIVRVVLKAKPAALLVEAANPRHAHEWAVWREVDLPDDKVLVPGVIDTTTNFVEHPRLVAERIVRFAKVVGRERVIAGTDCGFGTFAGFGAVHPTICWPKLRSLVEGAEIASDQLW